MRRQLKGRTSYCSLIGSHYSMEKIYELIEPALKRACGKKAGAAVILGYSRVTLWKKSTTTLIASGLDPPERGRQGHEVPSCLLPPPPKAVEAGRQ